METELLNKFANVVRIGTNIASVAKDGIDGYATILQCKVTIQSQIKELEEILVKLEE